MYQTTINNNINFKGIGLHTGVNTNLKIIPSEANTGIVFRINNQDIKANIDNLYESSKRGTTLKFNDEKIYTVEHILSALYGLEIDNAIIEVDNVEIPILDGSNKEYTKKILDVGIKQLTEKKKFLVIDQPIEIKNENSSVGIYPYDGFKITFEIDFKNENIGKQSFTLESLEDYEKKIATARTFCTFNEIIQLKEMGLILGGNLDNAIIYTDHSLSIDKIKSFNNSNSFKIEESLDRHKTNVNNKKLLFDNEAVRHKILDLIGDFALLGKNIKGHIISHKGGHEINTQLVKKINLFYKYQQSVKYDRIEIEKIIPHRDPFLLIDQIVDFREGEYVHAIKYVDEKESYFQGHFPGNPVLPGVLIIECMAQASCFLSLSTVDKPDQKLMLLSVIRSAKFFKKVIPGDILSLEVNLLKFRMNNALIKGIGFVNGEKVAEAEWMATVVDK
ncbi:MAG: UDP-3-O-[3-hydroxymyristoyl] N-acetylglucosamine deacetylase [Candidatus Marinimicrobia bacterium]|nr:UDP-3-O-[3-hydroxymyristoyl] N-acetylglucosamine deacetylase [Candidatus Neomarinimicrobiota bacterium]|tara:strand:- start:7652 stop:8992 length:1341 start_codon:yes stop_codon:yes gene_type:complete